MSTKSKPSTFKEVAGEAIHHVACAEEVAGWMYALMVAIHDDHEHSHGSNSPGLARIGVYISENHAADLRRGLEMLNAGAESLGGLS